MKTNHILPVGLLAIGSIALLSNSFESNPTVLYERAETIAVTPEPGCVFMTLMGEQSSKNHFIFKTPQKVVAAADKGLKWIEKAQQKNGGWGAGLSSRQNNFDPHSVKTDPATTSMVAMALLRNGNSLEEGTYSSQLSNAVEYLLKSVESAPKNSLNITTETSTQIQVKLGANIDVVMTAQFLSNLSNSLPDNHNLKDRVMKCLNICVEKIQKGQNSNGSSKGGSWAGVLQSSFATNALESAQYNGAAVDTVVLEKARKNQTDNYDPTSGSVNTSAGAGIMLYSVSGSVRASAKDAREVKERVKKAKEEGAIPANAVVSPTTLQEIGYDTDEAIKMNTSYNVYNSARDKAQQSDVVSGFGNNGGEEFLSFLQTGESMVVANDDAWTKWFDDVSGRLLSIQNNDGSWQGHHCITSPVFCTATCLMILSVENDLEALQNQGSQN
jgi:hypothetical protein